jgi:diacylglycerol kinase family enzyme
LTEKSNQRTAAIGALLFGAAGMAIAVVVGVQDAPRGLIAFVVVVVAAIAAWYGLLRTGPRRVAALFVGVLGFGVAFALMAADRLLEVALVVGALIISSALARAAFRIRVQLPARPAPRVPVLFFNPKSGGGKAEKFSLPEAARARGIEPIELVHGQDLETLVRDAIAKGADGLAMAGGDGSQAIVAAIAAEFDVPYACVPAGTRNHFALDLGVDRNDVVGALDAFVNGGERRVDLAEVNGRVFVNNVSLGIYAEAVQQSGYRDAKQRTMLDTVPAMLGPEGAGLDLRWTDPSGKEHTSGAVILVSNNRYRLGRTLGSGTRPRLDEGLLGVAVVGSPSEDESQRQRWREWTAPAFEVDSEGLISTGIDGEAAQLQSPIRFRIREGVLRVRVAPQHPGASPSAALPDGLKNSALALVRIAIGRDSPGTRVSGSSITNATSTKEI